MSAVLQAWGQDAQPAAAPEDPPPFRASASEDVAADSSATSTPLASTCRPACRSGFTCLGGECVSSCNPLCPQGYVCTEAAQCVREQAGHMGPVSGATDTDRTLPPPSRSGFVIAPRVALLMLGSGRATTQSRISDGVTVIRSQESVDFDDESRVLLAVDALFHLVPVLRVGFGAFFVPSAGVRADGGRAEKWGKELAPIGVFEGIFGGNVAGTIRAFVGANILFSGADLQDAVEALEQECNDLSVEGYGCVYELGPFVGLTLGASGGVVGRVSDQIALRGDLMVQYLSSSGPSVEAAGPNSETWQSDTAWSTTRAWILFGLEF